MVDKAQPPQRKSKPKKLLIGLGASLLTGFALLVFVFARQAWRNAMQDATTAEKLRQLR